MVNWSAAGLADREWDAALARVPDANIFQSSAWARHKADFGWRPIRALAGGAEAPRAAVQALVKRMPGGARVLWARGGPVGDPRLWNAELRELLRDESGGAVIYCRVCPYREADAPTTGALGEAGWAKPKNPLDLAMTYLLDLGPDPDTLKANLSLNWRHNLKRGNARAAVADWNDPDPKEMEAMYLSLEAFKRLPPLHRADALGSLVRALGPALVLKRVLVDGRMVALRACAVFGDSSMDLLAASAGDARKVYASYSLLWTMFLESKRLGAKAYDLGGVNPGAAPGVSDFKKGTGARLIETLGERDFASPSFLHAPAGALIAWKLGKNG